MPEARFRASSADAIATSLHLPSCAATWFARACAGETVVPTDYRQETERHDSEPRAIGRLLVEEEALRFIRDLIRIESVNTGDLDTIGDGETRAARYVQAALEEVGYETTFVESRPGRGSVVARLAGRDRVARGARRARPPRRRPRRRAGVDASAVRRRDRGRRAVRARRRRHEELRGRHPRRRAGLQARRRGARARPDLRVLRRRGGRRRVGRGGSSSTIPRCSPGRPRR